MLVVSVWAQVRDIIYRITRGCRQTWFWANEIQAKAPFPMKSLCHDICSERHICNDQTHQAIWNRQLNFSWGHLHLGNVYYREHYLLCILKEKKWKRQEIIFFCLSFSGVFKSSDNHKMNTSTLTLLWKHSISRKIFQDILRHAAPLVWSMPVMIISDKRFGQNVFPWTSQTIAWAVTQPLRED